jgi:predicted RNase H-like nuclease (RuvC/YqgF family)
MEQKNSKIFDKKNIQTVSSFCLTNNIEDVDEFIYHCFKQGFDIKRFGLLGKSLNEDEKDLKTGDVDEKQLIKEVIVEKRVEIPVEVIKEVIVEKEVIKEIPVEKIVTKVEYISDKSGENELIGKIEQLEEEMSKKDKELDEVRRNLDIKLDNSNEKMLEETLQKLRKELLEKNKKIEDLQKINEELENKQKNPLKAVFMRGSNLKNNI